MLAENAARRLVDLHAADVAASYRSWEIEHRGDEASHQWLTEQLRLHRPDDAVLSEEGEDDLARVDADRVWIVDPLDGSSSYGIGSPEWAVHVALVVDGVVEVGAVSAPGVGVVGSTYKPLRVDRPEREVAIVATGRTRAHTDGVLIANAIGAEILACSSAGVKAALVATGRADIYVHDSPLYEWDVCAPAAMAMAAGLEVAAPDGAALVFNKARPVVSGLVICVPELAEVVFDSLASRRADGAR